MTGLPLSLLLVSPSALFGANEAIILIAENGCVEDGAGLNFAS